MMTDMTTNGVRHMIAMGIDHLAIFAFAVLGIAASIKYLRSHQRSSRGPRTAPATVHSTIVPPYQTAMNGSESSVQCSA